jgi:glyoxylase-like metal-dependent hydrolase (beta-lactamase superfamily II)
MERIRLVLGVFHTNTYIVIEDGNAVIIDPAGGGTDETGTEEILNLLEEKSVKLTHILLTHGHFDHTSAAAELKKATGAKIHVHESDAVMLGDVKKAFASSFPKWFKPCSADVLLKDGDLIKAGENGDLTFTVVSTPGHSAGSVMYMIDDVIFSGDTIFEDSVGRNDGYSGCIQAQKESMELIKKIDGNYIILPGHGPETTLIKEKKNNPFLI